MSDVQPFVFQDFTDKPDGPVGATWDSGQELVVSGAPQILNGGVYDTNHAGTGSSAYFVECDMGVDTTFIEATFSADLASGTTNGWTQTMGALGGVTGGPPIPDGAIHVHFYDSYCAFGYFLSNSLILLPPVGQTDTACFYSQAGLVGNGKFTVQIGINKATNTAYVRDPRGKVWKFVDSHIGSLACNIAWWESVVQDASTDRRSYLHKCSADTTVMDSPSNKATKLSQLRNDWNLVNTAEVWRKASLAPAVTYAGAGIAASGLPLIDLTITDVVVPASGQILVTVNCLIHVPTSSTVYLIADVNGTHTVYDIVCKGTGDFPVSHTFLLANLTPGDVKTIGVSAYSTNSDTTVQSGVSSWNFANMVVEPVTPA